jgi:hypothetical protein
VIETVRLAVLFMTVVRADGTTASLELASFSGLDRSAAAVSRSLSRCQYLLEAIKTNSAVMACVPVTQ